ncbi:MAG: hypothetical protein CVU78_07935 [Elusimicrobia bacterium HGW-Elusimicrobia-2]|nr:MAG: hypothetical protein CVU78_07935 [Elusimicrobia bacterium HGW-Elusimicrobia-2]
MNWMLVLVCLLLMILWLNFRVNELEKSSKAMGYSFQSLLDKIVKLRKRVERIEDEVNIPRPEGNNEAGWNS